VLEIGVFEVYSQKSKNPEPIEDSGFLTGGDNRDRTDDLLNAIQALSQLSYTPTIFFIFRLQRVF
jgi:fructose-bisphosphate aldolase class 1